MPTVTINTKYFSNLIGSVEIKKAIDQISKLGVEVAGFDDNEITLEITPNRPDLFCAVGLARSVKNFMHKSKKFRYAIEKTDPELSITVDNKVNEIRPYISAIIVKGMAFSEHALSDVINFTEKICEIHGRGRKRIAIGLHDMNKIRQPLYYGLYTDEKFVPLNEDKEMRYSEVIKNTEKGVKYGNIIQNGRRGYPALKDQEGTLALIPILNSNRTKVTHKTKDLLVDITGTSKYLTNKIAWLIASVFADLGCKVYGVNIKSGAVEEVSPMPDDREISVPLSDISHELGVDLSFNSAISLANKMGYYGVYLNEEIKVHVPEYRLDIIDWQDILEDFAIAYGYDYISAVNVPSSAKGSISEKNTFFSKLSELMVGLGFTEALNTYFTDEESNFKKMRTEEIDHVQLLNPKASTITMMRTSLIPSLLRDFGLSSNEKMPQRFFELDMVFSIDGRKPIEEYNLGAVSIDPKSNFNNIKAVVESLAYALDKNIKFKKFDHPSFIEGRCARIILNDEAVGIFGELHPEVLQNFRIEEPGVAFEISLARLYSDISQL